MLFLLFAHLEVRKVHHNVHPNPPCPLRCFDYRTFSPPHPSQLAEHCRPIDIIELIFRLIHVLHQTLPIPLPLKFRYLLVLFNRF